MALQKVYKKGVLEAGCDEAGRGCLAGPVYAAAVILPPGFDSPQLNDSKKLTVRQRNELREMITEQALAYAVAQVGNEEIDELNIFRSSILAMHRAIGKLTHRPQHLLIDGKFFNPYEDIPHQCIIKGDGKYLSIAAASVLAKTYRDEHMEKLHERYPHYQWKKNKGYPTREHREAILHQGISPYHRKSFRLLPDGHQLDIEGLE
jgi:ribonuclease HII